MPIVVLHFALGTSTSTRMQISEDMLWRFIDGDSSPDEAAEIERQLESSANLRGLYDDLLAYHVRFGDLFARLGSDATDPAPPPTPAVKRLKSAYDVESPVRSN